MWKVLMEEVKADDVPVPTDGGGAPETPPESVPAPEGEDEPAVGEDGSTDYSGLADEDLTDPDVSEVPPTTKAVEPKKPEPKVKPSEPEAEVRPPQQQKPIEETKPAETQPPASAQPVPTPTEEERKATYEKDRAAAFAKLTERYAVPEDQIAPLVTEPEKVIPHMLAKVHAEVMENVVQWANNALPQMIQQVSTTQASVSQAVETFYKEWPELKDPKHAPVVARVLSGYRQANPDAKPEDVIREGGVAALVALRLPIPERVLKQNNASQPDATQPANFAPAPRGSISRPPAKPESNVFTVIAEEDLQEGA